MVWFPDLNISISYVITYSLKIFSQLLYIEYILIYGTFLLKFFLIFFLEMKIIIDTCIL